MILDAIETLHEHYNWGTFISEIQGAILEQEEEGELSYKEILDQYSRMCYNDGEVMMAIAWLQIDRYGEPSLLVCERCLEYIEEELDLNCEGYEVEQAHLLFKDAIEDIVGKIL